MLLKELLKDAPDRFADIEIKGITDDSRKVSEGYVYVCIVGTVSDGHNYAASAVKNGASVIVAQKDTGEENQIIVEDTRAVYALMSAAWFSNPADKLKLVGVTGTNGKTSVTHIIKHILEANGEKVGLIGTIQNMIGDRVIPTERTTPNCYELNSLFADMVNEGCTYAVMEVSSHALDQKRVYGMNFEVGIFTNLTQDHLDYHITMENYLEAKKRLFGMCKYAVVNNDDCYSEKLIDGLSCEVLTVSAQSQSTDYFAREIDYRADGVSFVLDGKDKLELSLSTGGKFSVYNAMSAVVASLALGIDEKVIKDAVCAQQGVKGRAEVFPCPFDFTVIIDYAHTPDGLENILSTFNECKKGRLVVLFGCGGDRDKTKRSIMGRIAAEKADFVIVTSDNPRSENPTAIIEDILVGMKDTSTPYAVIENRIEAINYAVDNAVKNDIIVLAGKGHETYQILANETIHLDEREILSQAMEKRKEVK
ncbi:MAG: UDP-N-acetylmuramoyl-L-alanyl-D-glutamate--2,6-diaminopimelate ligase [Acutalibacteraceae bacterium]|nr:UDP-N-acetylmuramoyl-L-alanyl-D-glutamate--2,6-diaminopimelate ligase [Acutalibacteraceae bacterium]